MDKGKYIETDISMGRNEGNGSEDEGQDDGYGSVEGEDVRMEGPSRIPMTSRGERVGPDGFGHVISVQRGTMAGRLMRCVRYRCLPRETPDVQVLIDHGATADPWSEKDRKGS